MLVCFDTTREVTNIDGTIRRFLSQLPLLAVGFRKGRSDSQGCHRLGAYDYVWRHGGRSSSGALLHLKNT